MASSSPSEDNEREAKLLQPMSETWVAADGTVVTIRPISAADLALEQEFVDGLSASTGYQRLMSRRRPSFDELRRFTDINPERELALIAIAPVDGGQRQIGVARYVKEESSPSDAEFAIVLSDDWQGRGLGTRLLGSLLVAAKSDGVHRLVGTTMSENRGMLALATQAGVQACARPRLGDDHQLDDRPCRVAVRPCLRKGP